MEKIEIGEVRQEVLDFAVEMERILRKNDAEKGDSWKTIPLLDLEFKFNEEYEEWVVRYGNDEKRKEVTDSACVCMMLFHRYKE